MASPSQPTATVVGDFRHGPPPAPSGTWVELNNAGNRLWLEDKPLQACQTLQQAIQANPDHPAPYAGLGNVLRDLNRFEAADRAFRIADQLGRDGRYRWNHSQVLVGLERYGEAWLLSEARMHTPGFRFYREGPYWQGWSIGDPAPERLTVWSEQGYGDTFQFLRWLVPLSQQGIQIVLEVEPSLVSLMQAGLSWLPTPIQLVTKQATPQAPKHPCQGSLLSLPSRGKPEPRSDTPYLRLPQQASAAQFRRVGITWAAGREHENPVLKRDYQRRSLPLPALKQLLRGLHELNWSCVNLQIGPDRDELSPDVADMFDNALPNRADFLEAGHWLESLQAVISVDTATAHQAGAQGRPCWVLLPWSADPRWLRQRSDTPWYPCMRLMRQGPERLWAPVIDQLLHAMAEGHAP